MFTSFFNSFHFHALPSLPSPTFLLFNKRLPKFFKDLCVDITFLKMKSVQKPLCMIVRVHVIHPTLFFNDAV
jgi:hypothetical protein